MGLHAVLKAAQLPIQFRRGLVGKPVNHPFLMALRDDQAVGPQIGEVLGNGDLGHFQNILKVADTKRPSRQKMKNAKAGFIAEAAINLQELHIRQQTYTPQGI